MVGDISTPVEHVTATFQSSKGTINLPTQEVPANGGLVTIPTPPLNWNDLVGLGVIRVYWHNEHDMNFQSTTPSGSRLYSDLFRLNVIGPLAPTLPDDVASVSAAAYIAGSFSVTYSPYGMTGMLFVPTGGSGGLINYTRSDNTLFVRMVSITGWDQSPTFNDAVLPAQTHLIWVYTSNSTVSHVSLKGTTTSAQRAQIFENAGIMGSSRVMYYVSRTTQVTQTLYTSLRWINHNYSQQSTTY
jgi:hypothetical protein